MIQVRPKVAGNTSSFHFKTDWSEVGFGDFLLWQELAKEIQEVSTQIQSNIIKRDELIFQSTSSNQPINKVKLETLDKKRVELRLNLKRLEVEGIALFCNIPIDLLLIMEDGEDLDENFKLTDDHFHSYRILMNMLVVDQIPTDQVRSFVFQSKTDQEIEQLEQQYKSMPYLKRHFTKAGRNLKQEIKQTKATTYHIKDIWLMSTYVNKELQDIANSFTDQFKDNDWSGLGMLVALLCVEQGEQEARLQSIAQDGNIRSALSKYRQEVIQRCRYKLEVFTKQKKQLDIATVVRIKNFFLPK